MDKAFATFREGELQLDSSVDWPDGTRVELRPLDEPVEREQRGKQARPGVRQELLDHFNSSDLCNYGLTEELWPRTPEEIQLLLEHMDAAEPLDLTADEIEQMEAEWKRWREEEKELVRRSWEEAERLFE